MDANQSILDPVQLVRQLDPDEIRRRLEALDNERQALLVLLRAAQRVQRESKGGGGHAD